MKFLDYGTKSEKLKKEYNYLITFYIIIAIGIKLTDLSSDFQYYKYQA